MSNVTSLSLLKGAKAAELGEELTKPDAAPAVEAQAEETVSVDVDTMSSDELDALVTEHGVEVPEEWPTLNVEAKRNWLKSQFEEAPAEEAVQSVEVAQVEEEKPAKKASKSKAVAAPTLQGEVVPDDMLADLVFEIENMKEKQALDTAALEFICLDYLGGQSLPQKLKSIGIEAALEALEKAFPNANIEVEITEDAA